MKTVKFESMGRNYELEIIKGKSITIKVDEVVNKFEIGDMAEYDSFNLSYFGPIVSITEKTVTIKEKYRNQNHRLKLETFAWRNRDFKLTSVQARNSQISQTI